MSDTTKLIIGIALAIVVLVLIVWLFASARRRETEAQRMEAEAVRARLAERLPVVQEREDRASVTARIAEEARREAEAAAAEAARLEREAAAHRTEADRLQDEQAALARQADLLDPDVLTDEEGYRVDESGRRLTGSTVASALGVGAAALAQEDDEPDLADHENPFAAYAPSADWVNDPVDEEAADELEARAEADSRAADWINGPDEDDDARAGYTTVPSEEASVATTTAAADTVALDDGAPTPDETLERAPHADADWVNGPADDEGEDVLEERARADAQAADWINGPEEDEATAGSARVTVPESSAQDLPGASGAQSEHSTGVAASSGQDVGSEPDAVTAHSTGVVGEKENGVDEGAPFDLEDEPPMSRRISTLEEVVDGGYGVGSAAALPDGAQPLGHPIMGFRDSMTFAREGEGAPAASADVWFYDEDAARRSGFRPVGEE
jgi:low affinity Fe/Cu permease